MKNTDKQRMWFLYKKHGSTKKAKKVFKMLYGREPRSWKYKGKLYKKVKR